MPCIDGNLHYAGYTYPSITPGTGPIGDDCSLTNVISYTAGNTPANVVHAVIKVITWTDPLDILAIRADIREDNTNGGMGPGDVWPYMLYQYAYRDEFGVWSNPNWGPDFAGWGGIGSPQTLNQWDTVDWGTVPPSPSDSPILTQITGIALRVYDDSTEFAIPPIITPVTVYLRNTAIYALIDGDAVHFTNFCPPDKPGMFAWDGVCRNTAVRFTWIPVDGATGYQIWKNGSLFATITGGSVAEYTATGQTPNVAADWAILTLSCSASDLTDSITVTPCCTDPGTPTGVTAGGSCNNTVVPVSWSAVVGASFYSVYKDGVLYVSPVSGLTVNISGQTIGVVATWTVTSTNACGVESGQSAGVMWTPCVACDPPDTPQGFRVADGCHGQHVGFGWYQQPDVTLVLRYWCGSDEVKTELEYSGLTIGADVLVVPCDVGEQCFAELLARTICGDSDPTARISFTPCCPCDWVPTVACTSSWSPRAQPTNTWKKSCGC